ncbi:hypothetical protein H181DRAFT_03144 [Streptomyces sp. WMMB 714]|uniref:hypothetical protein n=1 Tax=Streptomyces sp. WMMB 714 TaxID=1286822 RepID=UPI0005F77EE8|nr:hypothetical protein [Streptomyces sp. WMMB 714]SCK37200.1 hypothetical protein H181DRAFT_03144 [Streptomyces sp. WMMB 714]
MKRKIPKPIGPAVLAAYRCGSCASEVTARSGGFGRTTFQVQHSPGCPVAAGVVDPTAEIARRLAHGVGEAIEHERERGAR